MSDAIPVQFFKVINLTPALPLAIRGWSELNERGFGDGTMTVFAGLPAFVGYAQNGRDLVPAGVISYDYQEHANKIWVFMGYVLPEFRGRGIYRAMWNELVLKAMELKAGKIEGATHVNNRAMRDTARKLGRTESFVVLNFEVPAADDVDNFAKAITR